MTGYTLAPTSALSQLTLRVRDPEAMLTHYRDLLGLELVTETEDRLVLAPDGDDIRLILEVPPEAPLRPHPSVGLYHLALLVPSREALAQVTERLVVQGYGLQGAADHGVSEAIYLADPEGNGIEIYRDRPADAWPRRGQHVAMVTEPLDVEGLLAESPGQAGLPPATRLGHVHLHVADLETAGRFYQDLGLGISQSSYPGVLFLAAGGYHHHVGLNTWAGDRRAPEGATGLVSYTWSVPDLDVAALDAVMTEAGHATDRGSTPGSLVVGDPAGVQVRITGR